MLFCIFCVILRLFKKLLCRTIGISYCEAGTSFHLFLNDAGVAFSAQSVGGMFGLYFLDKCPEGFSDVMKSDTKRFNIFFHSMLEEGIYFAPSVFEAGFVSIAHTDEVIDETLKAAKVAFEKVSQL